MFMIFSKYYGWIRRIYKGIKGKKVVNYRKKVANCVYAKPPSLEGSNEGDLPHLGFQRLTCMAKRRNPILHVVSPVSQNLYIESLNQFYIFFARKYASFGHSLSFAIITESCRIWEQSTVSHPKKFCRFLLRGNTNFHRMFWFGPNISA